MPNKSGVAFLLLAACLAVAAASPLLLPTDTAQAASSSSSYVWEFYKKYLPDGSWSIGGQPKSPAPTPPAQPPVTPPAPPAPKPPAPPSKPPAAPATDVQRLLELLNAERQRRGAGPLELDPTLSQMAAAKASYMAANGYGSHYVPGYTYPHLTENLTGASNVELAHYLFLASPSHAKAMLNPRFTEVGIGVVPAGGGVLVIELFR